MSKLSEWASEGDIFPGAKVRTKPAGPKKMTGYPKKRIESLRADCADKVTHQKWEEFRPSDFVAYYENQHEYVYGVPPPELDGLGWRLATIAAGKMLKRQFEEDAGQMVRFVRWTWRREREIETKRRESGSDDGFRITWRYMFSNKLVTNWKLASARVAGKGR